MLKKIIATAVLGGTLALGAAGVAGAATTGSSAHPNCARAQAAVTRIVKLEAKMLRKSSIFCVINTWICSLETCAVPPDFPSSTKVSISEFILVAT